jgi:hypothetical protein
MPSRHHRQRLEISSHLIATQWGWGGSAGKEESKILRWYELKMGEASSLPINDRDAMVEVETILHEPLLKLHTLTYVSR